MGGLVGIVGAAGVLLRIELEIMLDVGIGWFIGVIGKKLLFK